MKRLLLILLVGILVFDPISAQRVWEEMENHTTVSDRSSTSDNEVLDITVKDGYVYITTSHPVTVKIFSILGQLISQKDLQPGTTRTRITARGIYILKIGSITRRIAI